MTDHNILARIVPLEKAVKDADDRSLRVGERIEELKDFVHTDINLRLATVEERTRNVLWFARNRNRCLPGHGHPSIFSERSP